MDDTTQIPAQIPARGPARAAAKPRVPARPSPRPADWRRRMSDQVAYALLVYTALQIFLAMSTLRSGGGSLLPYLALVILVIAIIPACRRFERRWNRLGDEQAHDPALADYFKRDRRTLWLLALGLPFAVTALFKGLLLVAG